MKSILERRDLRHAPQTTIKHRRKTPRIAAESPERDWDFSPPATVPRWFFYWLSLRSLKRAIPADKRPMPSREKPVRVSSAPITARLVTAAPMAQTAALKIKESSAAVRPAGSDGAGETCISSSTEAPRISASRGNVYKSGQESPVSHS